MRYVVSYVDGREPEVFEGAALTKSGIILEAGDVQFPILGFNIGFVSFLFQDGSNVVINASTIDRIELGATQL